MLGFDLKDSSLFDLRRLRFTVYFYRAYHDVNRGLYVYV